MFFLRATLLIIAAVCQVLFAFAPGLVGIEGDIGSTAERLRTALVPAGIAFSIWLILFGGAFYVAVWHAFRPGNPVVAQTGWIALLAFTSNAIWALHQPVFGPGMVSFALLEVILILTYWAAINGRGEAAPARANRIAYGFLFALAGWITVASPAGLSLALKSYGILGLTREIDAPTLMILFGWVPFAFALAWFARAYAFILPIVWGLVWVAVANQQDPVFATGVLALSTAFFGVTAIAKKRALS